MDRHPHFDLMIHDNSELESLLGTGIASRATLHEWPLSCVQRLTLPDGSTRIYKSECVPTVEPEFYQQVSSPLLVSARVLYRTERYGCLLLEDLAAPRADHLDLNEEQAVEMAWALVEQVAEIPSTAPVYLDVSTWERWEAVMAGMVQDLHGLAASGKYRQVGVKDIAAIARRAESRQVRQAYDGPVSVVQHDLSAENVFVLPGGFKVIDWQRPIIGPVATDVVLFLNSLKIDPRTHVLTGVDWMSSLLLIHWLTECSLAWFPPGVVTYDQMTAEIAAKLTE